MIDSFRGKNYFLSNFYNADVKWEGITYHNNEAAFQSAKVLDMNIRREFGNITNPSEAKRKGRKVKLREDWESVKLDIMYQIVKCKFIQNEKLKLKLLETNDEELVEGNNWHDTFWGCHNGYGQNNLGKILMKVRDELRKE